MDSYNVDDSYNGENILYTDHNPEGFELPSLNHEQIPKVQARDYSQTDIVSSGNSLGVANNMHVVSDFSQYPMYHDVSETLGNNYSQSQLEKFLRPHDSLSSSLSSKTVTDYNETLKDLNSQTDALKHENHKNLIQPKQNTSTQVSFGCTGCATQCLHTCTGTCYLTCSGSSEPHI